MERHIKPVDANVVDFPPPVTDGQKEWERRLAAELQPYLPKDQGEARVIIAMLSGAIDRFEGQRVWEQRRLAAYILGMFPEDRASARRLVSLLSCSPGEDVA
jgi:hypothetical protein